MKIDKDRLFDILYENVLFNSYSLKQIWKIESLLKEAFPDSNVYCDQGLNKNPDEYPTFKGTFYIACDDGIYEFTKIATYKDSKFDVINNMRKNNFKLTLHYLPSDCPNYWLMTPY